MGDYPSPELFYTAVREVLWHANEIECSERKLTFDRLQLISYDCEHECFTVLFTDDLDIWWIDRWRAELELRCREVY